MKHVLLINAHHFYENISPGRLNRTMASIITEEMESRDYEVRQTNIEQGYDIDTEVQNHVWADIIILQSPVCWFGAPWIHKKYVDEVFTAGMFQQCFLTGDGRTRADPGKQYGTGGMMQGKKYMQSLTWNAPGRRSATRTRSCLRARQSTTCSSPIPPTTNFAARKSCRRSPATT